jgi:hypothetical protein
MKNRSETKSSKSENQSKCQTMERNMVDHGTVVQSPPKHSNKVILNNTKGNYYK